jgi:hypothetical protein
MGSVYEHQVYSKSGCSPFLILSLTLESHLLEALSHSLTSAYTYQVHLDEGASSISLSIPFLLLDLLLTGEMEMAPRKLICQDPLIIYQSKPHEKERPENNLFS